MNSVNEYLYKFANLISFWLIYTKFYGMYEITYLFQQTKLKLSTMYEKLVLALFLVTSYYIFLLGSN